MFITSPEVFTDWFNEKILDTCRKLTVDDVCLMAECKLIGRYRFYGHQDLETARGILQYEQMREKRIGTDEVKAIKGPPTCKRCDQPLSIPSSNKKGRRREYCTDCESVRSRERNRKWRRKRQVALS
jgi:hypothetical protein